MRSALPLYQNQTKSDKKLKLEPIPFMSINPKVFNKY
jgi:hypothetical protein